MNDQSLWNITAIDGRYHDKLLGLGQFVSEGGLISYRTRVEAEWLLHLASIPGIKNALSLSMSSEIEGFLKGLCQSEKATSWQFEVKKIEKTTNHDVKAIEYFLRDHLKALGASDHLLSAIHFACTSEDINNLSYALMLKDLRDLRILPALRNLLRDIGSKAEANAAVPLLSRTHGQTATPTTLGKEFSVFSHRLLRQYKRLCVQPIEGKINGAVGNYNAHHAALMDIHWPTVCKAFVEDKLGLVFNPVTTQIENHDSMVEWLSILSHVNTILIGFCRDIWTYISLGYFSQRVRDGEVGSSTMPHKVNPIDFENAEGNLGVANALIGHFREKLPISRLQRDLSDSTVQRVIGTAIGHSELAWVSLARGLGKIVERHDVIAADLDQAYEVLAEPVQTVMRRYGVVDAYERLKAATRGKSVTRDVIQDLIRSTNELPDEEKMRLRALEPRHYLGFAEEITKTHVAELFAVIGVGEGGRL